MRHRLTWLVLFSAAILITASFYAANVRATQANGFKATTLAQGTFAEFHVFNHSVLPGSTEGDDDEKLWMSLQKTEGPSDLYVQSNVWQPSGSTGWHTHPGHSLIIVTSGTLTEYEGPECKRHVYAFVEDQPAPTFVDPGHGHVHIIRNEGSVVATSIAVQLVPFDPKKANRRIDVPTAPEDCPNIQ
jgi:hypothetical protein